MDLSFQAIQFPRPVSREKASAPFMEEIRGYGDFSQGAAGWFLGQNGWLWKDPQGTLVAVDPYLTDYCAAGRTAERTAKSRLLPVFIEPEDLEADLVLITHSHCDHADPYTWERYPRKETTRFLAPWDAAAVLRGAGVPEGQITVMHPGQQEYAKGVSVTGVFAEPTDATDLNHLGYLVRFSSGFAWYNTGDTARSELTARQIRERFGWGPGELDLMTVCINGGYNNLGPYDAARLTAAVGPKAAVPAHYDLMPHNLQMPHLFAYAVEKLAPQVRWLIPPYYRPLSL